MGRDKGVRLSLVQYADALNVRQTPSNKLRFTAVFRPLSLPHFSVQIKHKNYKNMNSVQQQCEHHHVESTHRELSFEWSHLSLDGSGF